MKISKIAFLLTFLCISTYAQEDQWILDIGVGNFNYYKGNFPDTKMISFGLQEEIWGSLKDRITVGGWGDTGGYGRNDSLFISGQLGFEVNNSGTIASVFTGPCLISTPDYLLGGYFQFMTDFHLGIQDSKSNYLGVMYRHISSAGLETPNYGRDILGLEIRF